MTGRGLSVLVLTAMVGCGLCPRAAAQDPGLVTIPVDFEINGRPTGQVIVRARPDLSEASVQGASLKSAIAGRITPAVADLIAALSDDFVLVADIRAREVDLVLDLERLVIVLKAAEIERKPVLGGGTFRMGSENLLRPELRLAEANVSGYTNVRVQDALFEDEGRDRPLTVDMQNVLNVRGWALSADTLYTSERTANDSYWTLGDVALTHDIPERALRFTVGDFSSPIGMFQAGLRMGGVSISREFTLQPYENYRPTGTAAFQLEEPASVDVYLNGMRMRTLRLDAGTYNLEDFNLAAGANDLALHITSVSGRYEEVNLAQFTSRTLLRRGFSEFAFSAGYPMAGPETGDPSTFAGESRLGKYYLRDPMFSGFVRKGLTDTLTAEANAQGSEYWLRAAAGVELASPVGAFTLYGAANDNRATASDVAGTLAWERGFQSANLRLSTTYTGADFVQVESQAVAPGRLAWNHTASLSTPLPAGVDLTSSAYYQTYRETEAAWGAVTRVSRRLGSFVVSLSVQGRRFQGRTETGGFVGVSWSEPPTFAVRTILGAGDAGLNPGSSVEVNATRRRGSRFTVANLAVESTDQGEDYFGEIRYQDNSVLAEIAHRQVYSSVFGQEQRSTETVGTVEMALAFADGSWGVTRRIDDGFALVTTHPRWRDVRLGINPAFDGYEYDVRPPWPTAVLAELPTYRETTTFIQTVESDQVLESNDFVFFPSHRRGTRVVVGSDAIYTLYGTLKRSGGEALAYQTITLSRAEGTETAPVSGFTNVAGRFVVGPIAEGTWRIRNPRDGEWTEVEVGGDATIIRLGTLQLRPED